MTALPALTAILAIGLTVRLTRLIVMDRIMYPLRAFAVVHLPAPIGYLVCCAWCMSMWVAAGVGAAAYFWGHTLVFQLVALAGTASLVTGLHATWLDPNDDGEK